MTLSADRKTPAGVRTLLRRQIRIAPLSNAGTATQKVEHKKDELDEHFIQDLAFRCPEVLPVGEIPDARLRFAPLISLAREVPTGGGAIDVLYISAQGYVTILETKLWDNPEARREVVAQVIDYAAALKKWSSGDLLNACLAAKFVEPLLKAARDLDPQRALYRFVSESTPTPPTEAVFYDTLERSLARGELLLLVAGDGIKANVESMKEYIQHPGLLFTLGLVELKTYELDRGETLLVVPHVVASTREELVRTVISVSDTAGRPVASDSSAGVATALGQSARGETLSDERFRERLLHESGETPDVVDKALERISQLMDELGLEKEYGEGSFSAHLPDPLQGDVDISIFVVRTDGTLKTGWMKKQLNRIGLAGDIADSYLRRLADNYKHKLDKKGYPYAIKLRDTLERPEPFEQSVRDFVRELQTAAA